jgi:hypothetical protein
MKKLFLLISVFFLGAPSVAGVCAEESVWMNQSDGLTETEIRCVLAAKSVPGLILAGTVRGIYRSTDSGQTFQLVQGLPALASLIWGFHEDPVHQRYFAATDTGLYMSSDQGQNWQVLYAPKEARKRRTLSVYADTSHIYLGTLTGLKYRPMDNSAWKTLSGELRGIPVHDLSGDHDFLYISTGWQIYRMAKKSHDVTELLSWGLSLPEESEGRVVSQEEDPIMLLADKAPIKDIWVTPCGLYVAGKRGILMSTDGGQHWQTLETQGLPLEHLTGLAVISSAGNCPDLGSDHLSDPLSQGETVFVATTQGVYRQMPNGWELPLYPGLTTSHIYGIAVQAHGTIWAATDQGLFMVQDSTMAVSPVSSPASTFQIVLSEEEKEPTIQQVQHWAVIHAEVHPDKINRWRREARLKALVPSVSVGVDRADSELYHWDTGPNPDALLKGREYLDWDVSVSWDFSEMVWSSDQTTIDSRSKQMVELREDILDHVTRLYFERRRLQKQLQEQEKFGQPVSWESHLRMEELTALIDGLTGGAFSRQLPSS